MSAAYETVIGLEVHAQLLSATKLFSGARAAYGDPPNTHVDAVTLGLPGSLPVPNRRAVELAVRAALALNLTVQERSRFDRKHYFYPDLPKGYQISQYERPIALEGWLDIETEAGASRVRIQRIHMEEDAAKNLHDADPRHTHVDFNRAGVPLIEIVTHPDLRSGEAAEAYLRKLRDVLLFAGVNDGNLEEGSFRCDANVSIRPRGAEKLGTRVELKNINSFRFVRKAIEHEAARQEAVLAAGGTIVQETRTWVDAQQKTVSMRGKEEAHDYRYFPDPDLPELVIGGAEIEAIRAALPPSPEALRARWVGELGLTEYDAGVLTSHPGVAAFFERVAHALVAKAGEGRRAELGKRAANFIQAEVLGAVTTSGLAVTTPVAAEALAELLAMVEAGTLSGKMAKEVYAEMAATGDAPEAIVAKRGLVQSNDVGAIEAAARELIAANPKEAAAFRGGKANLLGFFVGRVLKATGGTANPALVSDVVRRLLAE